MARRFQSARTPESLRRKTEWIGGVQTTSSRTTIGAATATIMTSFDTRLAANANIGASFTIVRIRGIYDVGPLALAADMDAQGAFGICVVNGEAFDVGITAVISPVVESFDDRWLYHSYWSVQYEFSGAGNGIGQNWRETIDNKAMRKVSFGDVVISVVENGNAGDNVSFFTNFRMLVKLS